MVETGGLENRFTLTGNGGSNPSPSATIKLLHINNLRPGWLCQPRMIFQYYVCFSTITFASDISGV